MRIKSHYEYNDRNDVIRIKYENLPDVYYEEFPTFERDSFHYDYHKNERTMFLIGRSGEILKSTKAQMPKDHSDWSYDEHGNLIENPYIRREYLFDRHKNWISHTDFRKRKGGKEVVGFIRTRYIKYRK